MLRTLSGADQDVTAETAFDELIAPLRSKQLTWTLTIKTLIVLDRYSQTLTTEKCS